MINRQRGKAYNGIHGSAYIMGHVGKKYALCLIGAVRLHEGIL